MNDTLTVLCPKCGRSLTERTNRENGSTFLGCEGFALGLCSFTRPLPEYIRLRRSGATELPGFGEEG